MATHNIITTIIAILLLITTALSGTVSATQKVTADVVSTVDNVVTVETNDGNIYTFYGEGFESAAQAQITFIGNEIVDATAL